MANDYYQTGYKLLSAINENDLAQVKEILDSGFDPNYVPKGSSAYNGPAINYAISSGNTDMVAAFIEKGATVNYINGYRKTSLDFANGVNSSQEMIEILKKAEAVSADTLGSLLDLYYINFGKSELLNLFINCVDDIDDLQYAISRIGNDEYESLIDTPEVQAIINDCAGKQHDNSDDSL